MIEPHRQVGRSFYFLKVIALFVCVALRGVRGQRATANHFAVIALLLQLLSHQDALLLLLDVAKGLCHMHSQEPCIMHRDVKQVCMCSLTGIPS
jgi:serine/threonine protein kinase